MEMKEGLLLNQSEDKEKQEERKAKFSSTTHLRICNHLEVVWFFVFKSMWKNS